MKKSKPKILKYSGEQVAYDENKLRRSLLRSGANNELIDLILKEVRASLFEGITTEEIYKIAFDILSKQAKSIAARYKLKKAIMELGPSGFPFEKYVSRILVHEGYETKIGVFVHGLCVNHEIDVIASKANNQFMVECKFHSEQGRYSHVKVPLYIQSRFLDIVNKDIRNGKLNSDFKQGWIYTNTRFTKDAIQYGHCAGLKMVGWDQPLNAGLKESIDKSNLYPITCLGSISIAEKQELLKKDKVLCSELISSPKILEKMGISKKRQKSIIDEALSLCNEQIEFKNDKL